VTIIYQIIISNIFCHRGRRGGVLMA